MKTIPPVLSTYIAGLKAHDVDKIATTVAEDLHFITQASIVNKGQFLSFLRQEYGEHGLWVRPKQMFLETVKVDGRDVPRFQPLGSSSERVRESVKNIFDDLRQHLPKELVQILVRAADVRIGRIISYGHASPADFCYDQPRMSGWSS